MTSPRVSGSGERRTHPVVLLVEDEPFVREATCRILQNTGLEVLTAANADEARTLYEASQHKIDLLMSDMVLPGRSGHQLGQDLRLSSPNLPILLTSGYAEPEAAAESFDAKTYYLPKPYSRSDLVSVVGLILGRMRLRRAASQSG